MFSIIRVLKTRFQTSQENLDRLFTCNRVSALPIHSQSIQAVYEKYLDARENARKARRSGYTQIRYPYKQKQYFNTVWKKDGFRIGQQGRIELSLGLFNGKL